MSLAPGLYADLDRANLPPGLSYSGAKDILKSPALYQWKRDNRTPPSAAMELGTVLHSIVLGTGQTWQTIDGGTGVSKRREAARAEGFIPVTLAELAEAARMAAAIWACPEAAGLLMWADLDRREIAAIAPDPVTGTWVRGYFDALHNGGRYGVDVKTGRDGTLADFARVAVNLGYDVQAACYLEVMEWLGQPLDAFLFLIVESTPPYQVGVRELDAEFIALGRAKMRRALNLYAACTATGHWPGLPAYELVSAPRWALTQGA